MKRQSIAWLAALVASASLGAVAVAHDEDGYAPEMSEQDRMELERHLEEKREQMQELAREMGELSVKLADGPIRRIIRSVHMDGDRAMLGVSIESQTGDEGVRVRGVSPGGPAEVAGIETGDVIVAIGGVDLLGAGEKDGGAHRLMEVMAEVKPGDVVEVTVERDGERLTHKVTTQALGDSSSAFAFATDSELDFDFDGDMVDFSDLEGLAGMGEGLAREFEFVWHGGPWADMELVELTPQLGDYFGVREGLLVVRAPSDRSLGIVDGDVIVQLNGEAVTTPRKFTRALGRSKEGDVIGLDIVRQRGATRLEAQVPAAAASAGDTDRHKVIIKRRFVDKD